MTPTPLRTVLLWCPDWPVIAVGLTEELPVRAPVAVTHDNRVLACSPAARAEGVRPGLRRREAQSRCPWLRVFPHDPGRAARAFEPLVAAVEQVVAAVEVVRPGELAFAARGAARYFGGEERAAEQAVEQIAQECRVEAQAGIAEGVFAAGLAARAGQIVPPGRTPEFLAGIDVRALERPELTDRLRRLGIRTLGDFAALPAGDVLARFGFDAALAHRLAAGVDHRLLAVRRPPPDLVVGADYDEPIDRVDVAAFAARALAQRLHDQLAQHGLACTRLGIEAVTEHGQELYRTWRHDGRLTAEEITDRVRWQLEGWLSASSGRPVGGVRRLRLVPEGLLTLAEQQLGLWGEPGESDRRAERALARVWGLLGPDAVLTAVRRGGRDPATQVSLLPWGDASAPDPEPAPWPGRLPAPHPATVFPEPLPAAVHDAAGAPVRVSARLAVSGAPARLVFTDAPPVEITAWAGPWPVDESWWAPAEARRVARFQVCLADGQALLLSLCDGQWRVEARYD